MIFVSSLCLCLSRAYMNKFQKFLNKLCRIQMYFFGFHMDNFIILIFISFYKTNLSKIDKKNSR